MATAIKHKGKPAASIQVNSYLRRSRETSPTNMIRKTYGSPGETRCERFVYRGLTLPPKIWSRVYDPSGNVVEENFCEPDGSLIFRWTYLFDESGRKIQGNLHNEAGMVLANWFYNEHEEVTRRSVFNDAPLLNAA